MGNFITPETSDRKVAYAHVLITVMACAGLYYSEAMLPPGLTNIANICYANSYIQCLINNPTFLHLTRTIIDNHYNIKCAQCSKSGMKKMSA